MSFNCWKCHAPGHYAQDCPWNRPAVDNSEHYARIAMFIDWWAEGRLTRQEKRLAISLENQMHYGDDCPKALMIR